MIKIKITKEESESMGSVGVYDMAGRRAIADSGLNYDCTKIKLSEALWNTMYDNLQKDAISAGMSEDNAKSYAAVRMICSGPNMNDKLGPLEIEIEDGYFKIT